jgi:hypothetical protein
MDNVIKLSDSDRGIADVTIHELQHMSCCNNLQQFINLWSNTLYRFYAYFCAYLYKSYVSGNKTLWNQNTPKDKEILSNLMDFQNGVEYLVKYLTYNNEYLYYHNGSNISTLDCKAIGQKFGMLLENSGCEKHISENISDDIFTITKDIFTGNILKTWNHNTNGIIINCLRQAYLSTFNKDPWKNGTFIYQEIIFPSEVISISSYYYPTNNNYFKFLKSI